MPSPGGVTAALPIYRADPARLRQAVRCLQTQTHAPLQILLVPNGADAAISRLCVALADADPRIRVHPLPNPNLAAALNLGLRAAAFDLVARMDADDECPPQRLARQAASLAASPTIAALGTAFDVEDESGSPLGADHPPTEPADIRWRLLLGNLFCHGSMLLRRGPVLAVGGYDESFRYAQDYDLWLRLSRRADLANLSEALYYYRASLSRRHHEQALAAATAQLKAWSSLPEPSPEARAAAATALAQSAYGGAAARQALASIESTLTAHGPTRDALLARQLIAQRAGLLGDPRLDALRRAGIRLRRAGVAAVYLYGAGRHTAFVMDNLDALGLAISGLIDDDLAGAERHGLIVQVPSALPSDAEVLISSDAHEHTLFDASLPLRARGVRVWRIYPSADDAMPPFPVAPRSVTLT